ncbi:MAG: sigma factor-like helix-turn-helix DNA-binding protein [Phycisphaerae bacterium]|nr:sigma factor-like helix-turn-helix DNA-binding protein [Phycisphaerae bacterium]
MDVDLPGCIAGDRLAWERFVRSSAALIRAAVRRALSVRGVSADEIDDRMQEVYVRLLRNDCRILRTFDPARASLATWLSLVARTTVHEHERRRSLRLTSVASVPEPAAPQEPAPGPDHGPTIPWECLTGQQRSVLEMLFDEGLSVQQVAGRLEVDPQTVRSAKHKALTRLRKLLDPERRGDADE